MNFKQLSYFQDIVRTGSFTEAALQLMVSTAYFTFEKMTTKATSNLYCEYCEFPLLQNQQPIERDYFLFYHLEHAHPYTEDFLEIAKRYFR
ncbi:hypothetical protein [Streptococcus anginosus]|uniref:hypothetical protein n=1 Tax=Streptococcus anginosus TaxID=1328 RepID=UPI00321BE494